MSGFTVPCVIHHIWFCLPFHSQNTQPSSFCIYTNVSECSIRYGKSRTTSFFILLSLSEEALSSLFTLPPDYQKPSELYSLNTTVDSYQWVLCSKLKEHSLYNSILLLTLRVWLWGGGNMCINAGALRGQRMPDSPRVEVASCWELPDMGAGPELESSARLYLLCS